MIIALNNKSNLTKQDFEKYQEELKKINSDMQLILCPNLLNIGEFHLKNFKLGIDKCPKWYYNVKAV